MSLNCSLKMHKPLHPDIPSMGCKDRYHEGTLSSIAISINFEVELKSEQDDEQCAQSKYKVFEEHYQGDRQP